MAEQKSSIIKTLEMERASYAWNCVEEITRLSDKKKEYRSIALKLPAMVLTNGLGQSLAFLISKGEMPKMLYKHLQGWLNSKVAWDSTGETELIKRVTNAPSHTYRLATMEALALLNWFKRFAEARLPKEA